MMFEEVGKTKNENKKKPNRKNAQNRNKKTATTPAAVTREDDGIQKECEKHRLEARTRRTRRRLRAIPGHRHARVHGCSSAVAKTTSSSSGSKAATKEKPNKNKKNAGEDGEDEESVRRGRIRRQRRSGTQKKNIVRKDPTMTQGELEPSSNNNNRH